MTFFPLPCTYMYYTGSVKDIFFQFQGILFVKVQDLIVTYTQKILIMQGWNTKRTKTTEGCVKAVLKFGGPI